MSVNASWLRMFIEMRNRHELHARTLALGVQDVMFTHETAQAILDERRVSYTSIPVAKRRYHLSRNQRQFTTNPNHYMCVKDLFQMMGFSTLDTLDAFGNDQPDIEWDLCQPIPKEMHNRYDMLFDIGVLEHTSDIFQALENVGNLVKARRVDHFISPHGLPYKFLYVSPQSAVLFRYLIGKWVW